MKKTNGQTIVHMTQHRKLKNKQHKPHQKIGVISGAPERVSRSCSTCGTRRFAYVITNPVNTVAVLIVVWREKDDNSILEFNILETVNFRNSMLDHHDFSLAFDERTIAALFDNKLYLTRQYFQCIILVSIYMYVRNVRYLKYLKF